MLVPISRLRTVTPFFQLFACALPQPNRSPSHNPGITLPGTKREKPAKHLDPFEIQDRRREEDLIRKRDGRDPAYLAAQRVRLHHSLSQCLSVFVCLSRSCPAGSLSLS
jgi:hypothetical protein